MSKKGTLYVVSGPSGAGKGTVLKALFSMDNSIFYSVSATTRSPRNAEVDGVNYYFLTRESFQKMIKDNKLLEYTEFCDNFYGTPEEPVDEKLAAGIDVILEIEIDGAKQVKKRRPDCVTVFILPPDFDELARRLRGRNTENEEQILKRLRQAKEELKLADCYDYAVINDNVEDAAVKLLTIIKNNRKGK